MNDIITLAHGSGGKAMQTLISELFMTAFANEELLKQEDQARLSLEALSKLGNRLAFSTDSYVIDPLFFPGGDIGELAVNGTVNDVSMSGAVPKYLSCGFIMEEGLPLSTLKTVVASMAAAAKRNGVEIVTGDTKVVPRGAADKLFINTAGIGVIPSELDWGAHQIQPGDKVLVSGTLGDHGATILNLREKMGLDGELSSDCQSLLPLVEALRAIEGVRALRDATRGGVAAIVHEYASTSQCGINLDESTLPVKDAVRGLCEILGLDPLNFANEGKLVVVASPQSCDQVLAALKTCQEGQDAAVIGEVNDSRRVTLTGAFGGTRLLDLPSFEPLPRIC
jgi:hydrogenase expression/formation protein HypE